MGKKRKNQSHDENPTKRTGLSTVTPLPVISVPTFNLTSKNNLSPTLPADGPEKAPPISATSSDSDGWQKITRGGRIAKPATAKNYPELVLSPQKLRGVVKLQDLQQLVLWLIADGVAPQWLLVRNKQQIRRVVVLMVQGLSMDMFDGTLDLAPSLLPPDKDEDMGIPIQRGEDGEPELEEGEEMETTPPKAPAHGPVSSSPDSFFPVPLEHNKLAPCLQEFPNMFKHAWPVKAAGDDRHCKLHSPIASFLNSPIPKKLDVPNNSAVQKRTVVTKFLMTIEELCEDGYPLHSSQLRKQRELLGQEESDEDREALERRKADQWVESDLSKGNGEDKNQGGSVTEGKTIYAIDCEMCKTSEGFELTRVSVIGWDGDIVYDTLVKPTRQITDYLTRYSGMTAARLESVTTTLSDVQSHLLSLINADTILIGQSLNADLIALKFAHPHIVDTSVIYHHTRGPPYKASLKWLAQKYLKREIQTGGENGHDSIEDAKACLDLLKLKLERGQAFGTADSLTESIFKRLDRHPKTGAVVDYGDPSRWYGKDARRTVPAESDREIVDGIASCVNGDPEAAQPAVDFVWGRLRALEILRAWNPPTNAKEISSADPDLQTLAEGVKDVTGYVKQVWESLPPCTAFIVYSGTGDPREMRRLVEMKKGFKKQYQIKKWDELDVKWTDVEEQALKEAVTQARKGVGFWGVK